MNTKSYKKIGISLLGTAMAFSLASCAPNPNENSAEDTPSAIEVSPSETTNKEGETELDSNKVEEKEDEVSEEPTQNVEIKDDDGDYYEFEEKELIDASNPKYQKNIENILNAMKTVKNDFDGKIYDFDDDDDGWEIKVYNGNKAIEYVVSPDGSSILDKDDTDIDEKDRVRIEKSDYPLEDFVKGFKDQGYSIVNIELQTLNNIDYWELDYIVDGSSSQKVQQETLLANIVSGEAE